METKEDVSQHLELNYREVTCKRSVADQLNNQTSVFAQGIQDFDFSVSGQNLWIPHMTYFRIDYTIIKTANGTAEQKPICLNDGIALADGWANALYNNCYFRCGGQDVSSCTQYVAHAGMLKARLGYSKGWLDTLGRDGTGYLDADLGRRINKLAIDGSTRSDGVKDYRSYKDLTLGTDTDANAYADTVGTIGGIVLDGATGYPLTANVTSSEVETEFEVLFANGYLRVGDTVSLNGVAYGTIASVTSATILVINVNVGFNIANAQAGLLNISRATNSRLGRNNGFVYWQPPLGIFDVVGNKPLSSGDFKLQLNPNPNYQTAVIESLTSRLPYSSRNGTSSYQFVINNVLLYVAQAKASIPSSMSEIYPLTEIQVMNKAMQNVNNSATQNLDFSVPPSTFALAVYVQRSDAGTTTQLPLTRFKVGWEPIGSITAGGAPLPNQALDESLSSLMITYGSVTKPPSLYSSNYGLVGGQPAQNGIDQMQQRWIQSVQNNGTFLAEGGVESYSDWLDRGPIYYWDFSRDANDSSTYVNVQIAYNNGVPLGSNLFVAAFYKRQVQIDTENGFVVGVTSINR